MGIKYRADNDLTFLKYSSEEDLAVLARYLTHDKDGKPRRASELLSDPDFRKAEGRPDRHRKSWDAIAGELQHFGGDTLANLVRGTGVLYKEILLDVCAKLNVKVEKKGSVSDIETVVVDKVISDAWDKLSPADQDALLVGVGGVCKVGGSGLLSLQILLQGGGPVAFAIVRALAASLGYTLTGQAILIAGGGAVLRAFAGPFGLAASAFLLVPSISGAAYRVTIPAVIQIAYMRRAMHQDGATSNDAPSSRPVGVPGGRFGYWAAVSAAIARNACAAASDAILPKREAAREPGLPPDIAAEMRARQAKLEAAVAAVFVRTKSLEEYFELIVSTHAIGLACAAVEGHVSQEQAREINEFIAGVGGRLMPEHVLKKIERLSSAPPNLATAFELVSRHNAESLAFFDSVVEDTLALSGRDKSAIDKTLGEWRALRMNRAA
ncbi:hypothetical protein P350_24440 [Burkholderia cepacia JBK9]|uniref:DUF3944 domain-containing protein n=1 Tax=Burkholderia arboris TaxID=488730 RepID=A0A9Q9SES5_9BURK|nr:DUF3944 domain-containing protein [Burkholderia arboris]ALX14684.1 hypothetical protein P350_24440 [Burkholderia cepacia JBK9]MCA8490057.1 DUF3944 domain-containing protein [Burkholderia arboris]VWB26189.1 hypothetical protein BAR24066_01079 [Burkholderia arboris]